MNAEQAAVEPEREGAVRLIETATEARGDKLVQPAKIAVYDESEGGEEEDDVIITDPIDPEDPKPGDVVDVPDITVGIGKLILTVRGWIGGSISAQVELKEGASYMRFLIARYYDSDGKEVTKEEILKDTREGYTYFIRYEVREEYEHSIALEYEDGVKRSYDFQTSFGGGVKLTAIPKPEITVQKYVYTGEGITVEIDFLKELLEKYPNSLKIVTTESDDITQSEVGRYVVVICFEDGSQYCWDSANSGDRTAITVYWSIEKARVTGEWDENGGLKLKSDTYTGGYEGAVEIIYKQKGTETVVEFKDLQVGVEYTAEVVLKDTKHFELKVESPHTFTKNTVTVTEARPTIGNEKLTYTGQVIEIEVKGLEELVSKGYVKVTGEQSVTEVGAYEIKIEIIDATFCWDDGLREDITLTYEVSKAELSGTWNESSFELMLSSSYLGTYEGIVRYEIRNSAGTQVGKDEMTPGQVYTVTAILIDTEHFEWAEGMGNPPVKTITFSNTVTPLPLPKISVEVMGYTGSAQTFVIENWETYEQYLEIIGGSLRQTNAGEYSVTLHFKNTLAVWAGENTTRDVTLTFTISKAVLDGEWGNNGKVNFESSYTGSYDAVVEYVYTTMSGEVVRASQLKEGVRYKALVRLKDTVNFEFAKEFSQEFEFTYERSGSAFPWWLILIIILAIILIIIIIIIIVIVIRRRIAAEKKRDKEEDYSDIYGGTDGEGDGSGEDYSDIYGEEGEADGETESGEDYSDIYGEDSGADAIDGTDADGYDDIYGGDDATF